MAAAIPTYATDQRGAIRCKRIGPLASKIRMLRIVPLGQKLSRG